MLILGCLHTGSFHLIHLMFDDYVLYLLESLHCQERANDLMRAMKADGSTGETLTAKLPLGFSQNCCSFQAEALWQLKRFYYILKHLNYFSQCIFE